MTGEPLLHVPVYYDFASSLCYVTHRVMGELAGDVGGLGISLEWRPIDLSALRGLRRGAEIRPPDRERVATVAEDLGVALRIPTVWMDSRAALAAAAAADMGPHCATWRERVYSAIYEVGQPPETERAVAALAAEIGWIPSPEALAEGAEVVSEATEIARRDLVTGVPTFQLGAWPFGGIQRRDTMLRVLERFARKSRGGALARP